MSIIMLGSQDFCRLPAPSRQVAVNGERVLRIGLINNMSDGAIERTEHHFTNLLQQAADGSIVQVLFCSLPAILRSAKVRDRIEASYEPINALYDNPPDAIVVTGAEPREQSLTDELYWNSLTGLIDWIDAEGIPVMFSCLAAHAAVLHMDGVSRAPLNTKCFGVFQHDTNLKHPLMQGAGKRMWLPHTRWNNVSESELVQNGYQILSRSKDVGVGFFARQRRSLWLFCQGHPEYDGPDLLLEYRRDVGRYLSGQRANYPDFPEDYFNEAEIQVLSAFRHHAIAHGDVSVMEIFPQIRQGAPTWDAWRPAAITVFGNWLKQIENAKDWSTNAVHQGSALS